MTDQNELNGYYEDLFSIETVAQMETTQENLVNLMKDSEAVDFFGEDLLNKSIQAIEDKLVDKQMGFLKAIL